MIALALLACRGPSAPATAPAPAWHAPHVPSVCADLAPRRETTRYVGAGGDPGGDGSLARPWASVEEALAAIGPGTELRLGPGVHGPLVVNDPVRHRALTVVGCGGEVAIDTAFVLVGAPAAALSDVGVEDVTAKAPIEVRFAQGVRFTRVHADNGAGGPGFAFRDAAGEVSDATVVQRGPIGVLVEARSELVLRDVRSEAPLLSSDEPVTGLWCADSTVAAVGTVSLEGPPELPSTGLLGGRCTIDVRGSLDLFGWDFGVDASGTAVATTSEAELVARGRRVGLTLRDGATLDTAGTLVSRSDSAHGVQVVDGSTLRLGGATEITSPVGFHGLLFLRGSKGVFDGDTAAPSAFADPTSDLTISGPTDLPRGLRVDGGRVTLRASGSVSTGPGNNGLEAVSGAQVTGDGAWSSIAPTTGILAVDATVALAGPVLVADATVAGVVVTASEVTLDDLRVERGLGDSAQVTGEGTLTLRGASLLEGGRDGVSVVSGRVVLEDVEIRGHARAALASNAGRGTWTGGVARENGFFVVETGCSTPAIDLVGVEASHNGDDQVHACDGTVLP